MDQWLVSVLIALIGAAGAIIVAWIQVGRSAKKAAEVEAVPLEHRLTILEADQKHIRENMFNKEDRACLLELKTQMRFLLNFYVKEAAGALKNPPELRMVLNAMELTGYPALKALSISEKEDLKEYLDEQVQNGSDEKRQFARMLIGLLKMEQSIEDNCPQA